LAEGRDPTGTRDWLLHRIAVDLALINQRLTAIETRLGQPLTLVQWLKIATGLALPLAAILLALGGNIDAARRLLAP
jgi:hypothetical protein